MSGKQSKRLTVRATNAKLIHEPDLLQSLQENILVLDASFIIDLSHVKELRALYEEAVKSSKCVPISVIPVMMECLRSAETMAEAKQMSKFLTSLRIGWLDDIEKYLIGLPGAEFNLILRRCKVNNPSYTDTLLMFITQYFSMFDKSGRRVKLLTSNHNDIAHEIFNRDTVISTDNNKEINNIGVYSLNKTKYNAMLKKL